MRHTSVDVSPGTCYGRTDVPLRATFADEAEAVRRRLAGMGPFDEVWTSPLGRCARLAEYCGWPAAARDDRLMEMDFGEWEMRRYDEIDDPRLQEWYADYLHVAATGGESFAGQLERVGRFLDELRLRRLRRALVFTHGGVVACARVYAGVAVTGEAFRELPGYGGVTVIRLT